MLLEIDQKSLFLMRVAGVKISIPSEKSLIKLGSTS